MGNGRLAVILPGGGVILALLRVEARKEAIQVLRILKCVADDGCGVRVIAHVFAEKWVRVPAFATEDVIDQTAQKGDVGAGS